MNFRLDDENMPSIQFFGVNTFSVYHNQICKFGLDSQGIQVLQKTCFNSTNYTNHFTNHQTYPHSSVSLSTTSNLNIKSDNSSHVDDGNYDNNLSYFLNTDRMPSKERNDILHYFPKFIYVFVIILQGIFILVIFTLILTCKMVKDHSLSAESPFLLNEEADDFSNNINEISQCEQIQIEIESESDDVLCYFSNHYDYDKNY